MLQKSCEVISINKNRFSMSNVLSIDQKLNFVQTYEKIMIDIMKFEKIYTKFFFLWYFALCAEKNIISNIALKDHKSTLCLTSSEIILHQWQKVIAKFSSLIFIIVHEKRSSNFNLFKNWILITIMRKRFDNLKNWFLNLQYIFDIDNSRVFRVVILSFYEIFVVRILMTFIKRIKFNKKKSYKSK
jgi:hypothetical protein